MDNKLPAPAPADLSTAPALSAPLVEEKKPRDWFKPVAIATGLLVTLGLFGNIYLLLRRSQTPSASPPTPTPVVSTPTPNPTASWPINQNEKFGWEFRYPPNWEIKPAEAAGEFDSPEAAIYGDYFYDQPGSITPIFEIGFTGEKEEKKCFPLEGTQGQFKTSKLIGNNIEWTKIKNEKRVRYWSFGEKNKMCVNANSLSFETDSSHFDIFDQILASFRFLE